MTRLAVFDCDGTLIDSQAAICAAMAAAFAAHGLAPPLPTAVRRIVGLNLVEAVGELLPTGDSVLHAAIAASYKRAFHDLRARSALAEPLFDGIAEVLATLHASGWRLGVATGKSDRGLALALAEHGLSDLFVALQTADRHPSKPDPSMLHAAMAEAGVGPADTVMIGDTSYDIAMARVAGVRAVGVAWGYHPVAELHGAGADAVARRPADLPSILDSA